MDVSAAALAITSFVLGQLLIAGIAEFRASRDAARAEKRESEERVREHWLGMIKETKTHAIATVDFAWHVATGSRPSSPPPSSVALVDWRLLGDEQLFKDLQAILETIYGRPTGTGLSRHEAIRLNAMTNRVRRAMVDQELRVLRGETPALLPAEITDGSLRVVPDAALYEMATGPRRSGTANAGEASFGGQPSEEP